MKVTFPAMRVLSSDAEDVVIALLISETLPLRVVGHSREFGPKTL